MPDPQVLNTLSAKRREIECHIGSLKRDLEQARHARLAMPSTTNVPAEFSLAVPSESRLYAAQVRWRSFDELGAQFSGPGHPLFVSSLRQAAKPVAEMAPRRQQRSSDQVLPVNAETFTSPFIRSFTSAIGRHARRGTLRRLCAVRSFIVGIWIYRRQRKCMRQGAVD